MGLSTCITATFLAPRRLRVRGPVGEAGEGLEEQSGDSTPVCQGVLRKDVRCRKEGPLRLRCQGAVLLCLEEVANEPYASFNLCGL